VPGRIVFAGNPWPAGHRIKELTWSGTLRATGLWFNLGLVSADYNEEIADPPAGDDDWTTPITWRNYWHCTIRPERGFLAGTAAKPLSLTADGDLEFHVDVDPDRPDASLGDPDYDLDDAPDYVAFSIYLLGHDDVADHRIRFSPRPGGEMTLDWRGRIALTYAGEDEYKHEFHVVADGLRLSHIDVADEVDPDDAPALLSRFMADGASAIVDAGGPRGSAGPRRPRRRGC
jgi:hypothetical protein